MKYEIKITKLKEHEQIQLWFNKVYHSSFYLGLEHAFSQQ